MYCYTISQEACDQVFLDMQKLLNERLHDFIKDETLIDVDGSWIQEYKKQSDIVKLFNDYEVNAVYVDSSIQLSFLDEIAVITYKK